MCNFFSAIVDDEGKVYWKNGVVSHSELETALDLRDSGHYAKVELNPPQNGPFNDVDKWKFVVDEERLPDWWDGAYESNVRHDVKTWMGSGDRYTWNGDLSLHHLTSAERKKAMEARHA